MKTLICIGYLIIFCCISLCAQNSNKCYKTISCKELNKMQASSNIVLIDVRKLKDYEKCRLENAILASESIILESICSELDKSDTIVIYCKHGDRSNQAALMLCKKYRFKNVFHLGGGILECKKEGLLIDNSKISYD